VVVARTCSFWIVWAIAFCGSPFSSRPIGGFPNMIEMIDKVLIHVLDWYEALVPLIVIGLEG
jgi:hypothetical protein